MIVFIISKERKFSNGWSLRIIEKLPIGTFEIAKPQAHHDYSLVTTPVIPSQNNQVLPLDHAQQKKTLGVTTEHRELILFANSIKIFLSFSTIFGIL